MGGVKRFRVSGALLAWSVPQLKMSTVGLQEPLGVASGGVAAGVLGDVGAAADAPGRAPRVHRFGSRLTGRKEKCVSCSNVKKN